MWDPTPYVDALVASVHPSLHADRHALERHILRVVFRDGERRPMTAIDGVAELQTRPMGFVYDRPSGLLFAGGWADHERCAGCLMMLRDLRAPVDWDKAEDDGSLHNGDAADRYVVEGYGLVANSPQLTASSGAWPLHVGGDVALTAQEKTWFRAMTIVRRDAPRRRRAP